MSTSRVWDIYSMEQLLNVVHYAAVKKNEVDHLVNSVLRSYILNILNEKVWHKN